MTNIRLMIFTNTKNNLLYKNEAVESGKFYALDMVFLQHCRVDANPTTTGLFFVIMETRW
jgi:hypothetical protein